MAKIIKLNGKVSFIYETKYELTNKKGITI